MSNKPASFRYSIMMPTLRFFSLFITALLTPFLLNATIFTVTNTSDAGPNSLRGHIELAQPDDTIQFSINGTIFLDSTIWFSKNLHIQGPGPDKISIDGRELCRLFRIQRGDTVHFSGVTFQNGNAIADTSRSVGGGAFINEGFLNVNNAVFYNNKAKNGGAIENAGFGGLAELEMAFCTFYENQAIETNDTIFDTAIGGGAIYSNGAGQGKAYVRANNCTFSGNYAKESGGAIYLFGDISGGTDLFTLSCTITENTSQGAGGIRNERFANILLTNTIVAGNIGNINVPDIEGFIKSNRNNLIGKIGGAVFTPDSSDIIDESPLLAPLEDNGGGLPTHALSCLSPAINAGNGLIAPTTDQRGQIRIGDADIGAYEWTGVDEIKITDAIDQGKGSLRQAILLACDGDTLDMRQIDGTIELASTIEIDKSLTIWGNQNSPLSLSGNDSLRILDILPGQNLDISWITFKEGNPELFGGGAIRNKGHLKVSHTTFRSNQAVAGGAVANYGDGDSASFIAYNSTFSGNKAIVFDGGAIDIRAVNDPVSTSFINCTVFNNRAENKGGGVYNEAGGVFEAQNTIVSNNRCISGPDLFGTMTSLGHNLIGNDQDAVFSTTTGDLVNTNAKLAHLANYGGPTFTHRVLEGSPVIDAGDNDIPFTVDQRGEARGFNGNVDIGAYEFDPATSIREDAEQASVSLYPNPNQGIFSLQFSNSVKLSGFQIFSVTGQMVQSQAFASGSMEKLNIEVPQLPTGIYMIVLKAENSVLRKKFIIE